MPDPSICECGSTEFTQHTYWSWKCAECGKVYEEQSDPNFMVTDFELGM